MPVSSTNIATLSLASQVKSNFRTPSFYLSFEFPFSRTSRGFSSTADWSNLWFDSDSSKDLDMHSLLCPFFDASTKGM